MWGSSDVEAQAGEMQRMAAGLGADAWALALALVLGDSQYVAAFIAAQPQVRRHSGEVRGLKAAALVGWLVAAGAGDGALVVDYGDCDQWLRQCVQPCAEWQARGGRCSSEAREKSRAFVFAAKKSSFVSEGCENRLLFVCCSATCMVELGSASAHQASRLARGCKMCTGVVRVQAAAGRGREPLIPVHTDRRHGSAPTPRGAAGGAGRKGGGGGGGAGSGGGSGGPTDAPLGRAQAMAP